MFTGDYTPLNAITYFISRVLSGLSAQIAILYLFYKKKKDPSMFAHNEADTRNTTEEELLYKFDINNHLNLSATPTENLS